MPSPENCDACGGRGWLHVLARSARDHEGLIPCNQCTAGRRFMRKAYPYPKKDKGSDSIGVVERGGAVLDHPEDPEVDAGELACETMPGPNYTPDPDLDQGET